MMIKFDEVIFCCKSVYFQRKVRTFKNYATTK